MKKLVLISVLMLFVSISFSFANTSSVQNSKNQSITVTESEQNIIPIFKDVKSKVKTWFSNKKEQVQSVVPFDFNKKKGMGKGFAMFLVILGLLMMIGGMIPSLIFSLGIIDLLILLLVSLTGIVLWLVGLLRINKLNSQKN